MQSNPMKNKLQKFNRIDYYRVSVWASRSVEAIDLRCAANGAAVRQKRNAPIYFVLNRIEVLCVV